MLPPGGSVDSWYMMRAVRQPFPSCFRRSQKEVQKRRESSLQINVRGIAGSAFEQQAYLAQTCPPAPGSDRYRPLASAERRGLLYAWKTPVAPEGRRARLPSSLRRPRGNSGAEESLRYGDAAVGGVIQRAFQPLYGRRHGGVYGVRDQKAGQRTDSLTAHGGFAYTAWRRSQSGFLQRAPLSAGHAAAGEYRLPSDRHSAQ